MHFRIFLHMGSNIKAASTDKTSADPLDIQTEYCNVLSAASLESAAWMYLKEPLLANVRMSTLSTWVTYHPPANKAICTLQKIP